MAINIVVSTGKDYLKYLRVLMVSAYENMKNTDIVFYVLHSDLQTDDEAYLKEVSDMYKQELHMVWVDKHLFDGFPSSKIWPVTTYYRLMLHLLLPDNLDRALYLDIDVVVNGNLVDFYNLDFGDNFLIGSKENFSVKNNEPVNEFEKFEHIENFDIQTAARGSYVNAGVLLFNLKKFRDENVDAKYYLERINGLKLTLMDQSVINVCFGQKIKLLTTCKYNYRIAFSMSGYFSNDLRASRGLNGCYTFYPVQAKIIHYAGKIGIKPWQLKVSDIDVSRADSAFFEMIPEIKNYSDIWWKYAAMLPRDMYEKLLAPAVQNASVYKLLYSIINKNPYSFQNALHLETLTAPAWAGRNNISRNANIDIYTVPKVYICDAATKPTQKNLPADFTQKTSFRLTVKQLATSSGLVQILEADDPNATVWRRHSSDGGKTWGGWNRFSYNSGFDMRTTELEKQVAKLQSDLKLVQKLQRENTKLAADNNAMRNSLSFKLGRMITFFPRKIRNAFKRKK